MLVTRCQNCEGRVLQSYIQVSGATAIMVAITDSRLWGIFLVFVAQNIVKFLLGKGGQEERKRGEKRERQVGVLIT